MGDSIQHHATQLRQCAALGGHVSILQVGESEARVRPAADMLFFSGVPGPGQTAVNKALTRAMASAAAGEPNQARVTHLVQDAISAAANSLGKHLAAVEHAGGEIRYREAS